jgi:NAD(P)-dependent dehydrogenase (short-subunit alcohol dehydrogenase family)
MQQILNVSSGLASIAENSSGRYHSYRISKAALSMATANVALEVADTGVMCIGVEPGWAATGMTAASWSAAGDQLQLPDGMITAAAAATGLLSVADSTVARGNVAAVTGKLYWMDGTVMPF